MEYLNPRAAKVVALQKPTDEERGQWYFQRYVEHLPSTGNIALFDRSWYNRGGVEPVMGFCTKSKYDQFMKDAPAFEKMLVESGTKVVKFYFSVSKTEQAKKVLLPKTQIGLSKPFRQRSMLIRVIRQLKIGLIMLLKLLKLSRQKK